LYFFLSSLCDTVQPCDTTQVRSDSDFGVQSATVQVYGNSYNSQSDRWIELKVYVASPDMLVVLLWVMISGQSEFGKAQQYWSKEPV
jgi:hypothetical protein